MQEFPPAPLEGRQPLPATCDRLLAVGAVSHAGPYLDYFNRRTVAGRNKTDMLVSIGRKLLTTVYAILKSGRPYDPAYRSTARALAATV